jgi:hypothetical protein
MVSLCSVIFIMVYLVSYELQVNGHSLSLLGGLLPVELTPWRGGIDLHATLSLAWRAGEGG